MAREPNLEIAVMRVLWSAGAALSPGEVRDRLADRGLAYTTVMTVMVRLWEKGQLIRERAGRSYRYSPAHTVSEVVAANMMSVLSSVGESHAVLTRFARELNRSDVETLNRILTER